MHQSLRTTSTHNLLASPAQEVREPDFKVVLRKMWIYGFSEWLVFVTTLAIYPAVTVLVVSENKGNGHLWNGKLHVTYTTNNITCHTFF